MYPACFQAVRMEAAVGTPRFSPQLVSSTRTQVLQWVTAGV